MTGKSIGSWRERLNKDKKKQANSSKKISMKNPLGSKGRKKKTEDSSNALKEDD